MDKAKRIIPVLLILVLVTGLCAFYSVQKKGMFIDEIYTYGLSNSEYAPFITDTCADGDMVDRTLTQDQFREYLTVQEGEQFHFGSVYYNQSQDVHPPLHYWMIHLVSSFFPESSSKWIGLSINYVILLLTLFVLFRLTDKLFDSKKLAGFTAALYGLSTIALSTMLMIRMYMLLTFFTVLLAYWIACMMRGKKSVWLYLMVVITIFLGLMTQYYYVFYAFFVCAAYDIYLLVKKEIRSFWAFSISALLGVALLVIAYPACLQHLFADKLVSGGSMIDSLKNPSDWPRRFSTLLYGINYETRWVVRSGKLACALAAARMIWSAVKKDRPAWNVLDALVIIVPAVIAFVFVTVASPVIPLRYIYNLIPVFLLAVSLLLALAFKGLPARPWLRYLQEAAIAAMVAVSVFGAIRVQPEYLYPEQANMNALAAKFSKSPCVYFDNNFIAPITEDMLQLMQYEDVFVTNDADSKELAKYLEQHTENDTVVVYIDDGDNPEWSSRYQADEMLQSFEEETDYGNAEVLYDGAWLLTKTERGN